MIYPTGHRLECDVFETTSRAENTAATVLDRLVGRTWMSAETVSVLDEGRLVGRIDVADVLRSTDTRGEWTGVVRTTSSSVMTRRL